LPTRRTHRTHAPGPAPHYRPSSGFILLTRQMWSSSRTNRCGLRSRSSWRARRGDGALRRSCQWHKLTQ
jgi:hypothetical protein